MSKRNSQGDSTLQGYKMEEQLTAIIGIRVYPWLKKQMVEEAKEKGKTLSEYLHELIAIGWESINDED
jgi:hypothetical protein